ncbi:Rieske 2Fe-2S domain-containing protein [Mycolicibacterium sp. CBMA 226]|jgi:nitrite reductase (NADH) small subunit|uniref:Rieske (2Fe-2S) protein n=1 Tax=Mycolicibacterium sp. CBMA 226 TaxID=2606611 RepID=UPI0012DC39F7|nr:Rieske 2Fe-2S domain-containing protein [Mycolicibacterium sp. CBMA 226]MUL78482.1 Rieske 2Fe-2S domain-containing protein [Mycolicibacterium sp. CBMA 226]
MSSLSLGSVDDIPVGEGRAYSVGGCEVAVYRLRDGSLRALSATCPHRGGPLADGLIDDDVVVCPLHGHTYDLATGENRNGGDSVRAYQVTTADDGSIEIDAHTGPG